jgi:hypothetical protein
MVSLYALGQPISTDWSALYTPQVPGSYGHSMVVPEATIGHAWDMDSAPLATAGAGWYPTKETEFKSTADMATSEAVMTRKDMTWTRRLTVDRSMPATPVFVVRDTFDGEAAESSKVLTWNLLATGAVVTAKGELNPPMRYHPQEGRSEDPAKLPSALPAISLDERVSRMDFKGQFGVDFAVFTIGTPGRQATLGNWGNIAYGTRFNEHQHILRVKDTGAVTTVIVVWRENAKPEIAVREEGAKVVVSVAGKNIEIQ